MKTRKALLILLGLFIFYISYGLILSPHAVTVIPSALEPPHPKGFYDYRGVVNVHTTASTGGGDLAEVIRAAQEVDLDFISVTDLNQFELDEDAEGYHNKLLLLIDGEYTYLDSRILNLEAQRKDHLQGPGRSQAFFADLLSQKDRDGSRGLFILAHPFKPGFQWSGPYPPGLDGLEIVNLKWIWQDAFLHSKWSFLWTLLIYPFNPNLAFIRLFHIPDAELALWDQLLLKRKTVGLAGTDAESKVRFLFNSTLRLPSCQTLFSIVSNHILLPSELTGHAARDRRKISEALRRGQFYISLDIMANPRGFLAVVKNRKDQNFLMGADIPYESGMSLEITLPHKPLVPFETVIFKDGQKVLSSNSKDTKLQLHGPGVYRAMVRVIPTLPLPDGKKWIPWIFTNPFYLR